MCVCVIEQVDVHLVRAAFHRRSSVRPTAFLAQRLAALDAVDGRRRNLGARSVVLFHARLARHVARELARGLLGVDQVLYEEVMLEPLESVRRNLKPLPAQRARHLLPGHLVYEIMFETPEAEAVNARQRLRVVEHFQADGTSCPVRSCR